MAKGYPDFFGQGTFLKYGSTYVDTDSGTIVAADVGTWTEIINISAKGRIYGGIIILQGFNCAAYARMRLTTLTGTSLVHTPDAMLIQGLEEDGSTIPFVLTLYDRIADRYGVSICGDYTFEDNFTVEITNQDAGFDMNWEYEIYWSKVS
jgi:hypothetical protein